MPRYLQLFPPGFAVMRSVKEMIVGILYIMDTLAMSSNLLMHSHTPSYIYIYMLKIEMTSAFTKAKLLSTFSVFSLLL